MTGIELYSTTAANNNSAVPNGFPEGMAPSGVNDAARQMMAAIRAWYETAEWVNLGDTPTYIGATQFSLVGDKTATYQVGRRIKATGTTPFTIYGTITVSAYASVTTVTVVWDSGSMNGTLSAVALGAASVTNPSVGTAAIKGLSTVFPFTPASASGPASLDFAEDTDNGANKVTVIAPASLSGDFVSTLPASTGTLVNGSLGSTDNRLLRADGTGASTAQGSAVALDDSGNLSAVNSIAFASGQGSVGTNTNNAAAAGIVGEYIESPIASGSAVALVNVTAKNMTSISLTAGDWDVDLVLQYTGASSTTVSVLGASISLTTNTVDTTLGRGGYNYYAGVSQFNFANPTPNIIPPLRLSLSGTTTVYGVAYAQFATSTCSVYGILRARRVW